MIRWLIGIFTIFLVLYHLAHQAYSHLGLEIVFLVYIVSAGLMYFGFYMMFYEKGN